MKLKTRFLITFLAIILVPIVMTIIAFCAFTQLQVKNMKDQYGIEVSTEKLSDSTLMLTRMTRPAFDLLKEKAAEDPAALEDSEYLDSLNAELSQRYSYLVIRKGDEVFYSGTPDDIAGIFSGLPPFGNHLLGSDTGIYIGEESLIIKQVDFSFEDGSDGSAFIITKTKAFMETSRVFLFQMGIIILLVLVATSMCLSFWVYRGITGPMNQLRKAAQNIKDGNLDFTVESNGVEEFNDLCEDFEEMRQRLKVSTEEKISFDRENKELISNISHDLKTPITAVKGYVEGIMDGVADTPEKMDKYIRTIYNKANEMDRLINELTFYSKIDTNRIPYTFSKIHVSDYFNDCIEDISVELESRNVHLSYTNYVADNVVVIADAEQIKRVINNIVSNSLKYMNKKYKMIAIRLKDVGDFIQVEIEDNGKGIANKDLSSIFDRFYRTDASRNSSKGGSGIGLSIVKKILEDHGGKVWATSQLGEGAVMYFVLRKYQEVLTDE